MKKFVKNKMYICVAIMGVIGVSGYIGSASTYEPGSDKDPIVTKSYVDIQISKIKEYIDSKINDVNNNKNQQNNNSASLQVVQINKGESIILEAGSEIILRGGHGSVIDSEQGGIADLTQGIDLRQGYDAPPNHLLMIPRSDGRGIKAITNCTFMVKGKYEIN